MKRFTGLAGFSRRDVCAGGSCSSSPPCFSRCFALRVSHAQAGGDRQIAVSFTFPDGTEKHATVSAAEVERLSGQRPAYTLLPWVVAALEKLGLEHEMKTDPKGIRVTAIAGVANGSRGEWVYSVNGVPSPYRLSTQTISDVRSITFSYLARVSGRGGREHAAPSTGARGYLVILQPSLVPQQSLERVVGSFPRPFGGSRLGGTAERAELVAFVAACHLPQIDARVSVPEPGSLRVWYVRVAGSFSVSVGNDTSGPFRHAYYLVLDRSGEGLQAGLLPDVPAAPKPADAATLTGQCP